MSQNPNINSNLIPLPNRGANSFRVDANVPIPTARRGRERKPCPFPFADLMVGDSFLIGPCQDEKLVNQARSWAQTYAKEFSAQNLRTPAPKFITREVSDQYDDGRYWRIWRTE